MVMYRHLEGERAKHLVRSRCIKCGSLILGTAFQEYCLDCELERRLDARDDGELSQDSDK